VPDPRIAPSATRGADGAPAWLPEALHHLSQPLTALQCVLYMGSNIEPETHSHGMQQTIADALTQCARMAAIVTAMRERLEVEGGSLPWDPARTEH